jgi:hypothetical protein
LKEKIKSKSEERKDGFIEIEVSLKGFQETTNVHSSQFYIDGLFT